MTTTQTSGQMSPARRPVSGRRYGGKRAGAIILAIGCAVPAHAGQDPWAHVRNLASGTQIIMTTKSGSELKGRLDHAADDEIVLTTKSGGQPRMRRSEIQTIRALTADPVWNGVLAGAALGFAAGGAVGAAWVYGSGRYGAKPPGYTREFITGVSVFGSVVGALAGWRMDAGRRRSQVVYEADPGATFVRDSASTDGGLGGAYAPDGWVRQAIAAVSESYPEKLVARRNLIAEHSLMAPQTTTDGRRGSTQPDQARARRSPLWGYAFGGTGAHGRRHRIDGIGEVTERGHVPLFGAGVEWRSTGFLGLSAEGAVAGQTPGP